MTARGRHDSKRCHLLAGAGVLRCRPAGFDLRRRAKPPSLLPATSYSSSDTGAILDGFRLGCLERRRLPQRGLAIAFGGRSELVEIRRREHAPRQKYAEDGDDGEPLGKLDLHGAVMR